MFGSVSAGVAGGAVFSAESAAISAAVATAEESAIESGSLSQAVRPDGNRECSERPDFCCCHSVLMDDVRFGV